MCSLKSFYGSNYYEYRFLPKSLTKQTYKKTSQNQPLYENKIVYYKKLFINIIIHLYFIRGFIFLRIDGFILVIISSHNNMTNTLYYYNL